MYSLANKNTVSGTLYKVIVKMKQLSYYSYYTIFIYLISFYMNDM